MVQEMTRFVNGNPRRIFVILELALRGVLLGVIQMKPIFLKNM